MKLSEEVRDLLEKNDFFELEKLLKRVGLHDFEDALSDATFEHANLLSYTFICMLLIKAETAELHFIASSLLAFPLCHLEGAYASGYYHARKAVVLSPSDVSYKEFLLFFHEIPDQLLRTEEAVELATEVLKKDPGSKAAQDILKRYK